MEKIKSIRWEFYLAGFFGSTIPNIILLILLNIDENAAGAIKFLSFGWFDPFIFPAGLLAGFVATRREKKYSKSPSSKYRFALLAVIFGFIFFISPKICFWLWVFIGALFYDFPLP